MAYSLASHSPRARARGEKDLCQPAIGAAGALWLTTLAFAIYIDLWDTLTFGIVTCTLAIAWRLLMQKTHTLWDSVVFHTAGDVYGAVAIGF